jgi:hypothetical protein
MQRMVQVITVFLANAIASPAVAQAIRYELFPDLDVRSNTSCRTASAHVVDMKENQLCLFCALQLPRPDSEQWFVRQARSDDRPAFAERDLCAHAVTGSATINPFLPVIWSIDPASGAVQFCDIRHAGAMRENWSAMKEAGATPWL